jgi:hypothetical protein
MEGQVAERPEARNRAGEAMADQETLRRDRGRLHQRHESDAPRDGKRPGPSENPVTLSRYSNGAACVRTRSELTEGCGGRSDCQSAAPIASRPEGPGDSTNADALVRLAMDAHSRPAPCAPTRVEAPSYTLSDGYGWPWSRTVRQTRMAEHTLLDNPAPAPGQAGCGTKSEGQRPLRLLHHRSSWT